MPEELEDPLLDYLSSHIKRPRDRMASLTRRELETLQLLAAGCLRKEIAQRMNVSRGTVDQFIKRVYDKLRVHSKTEAVLKYLNRLPQPTEDGHS